MKPPVPNVSRREFLRLSAGAGSALAIGLPTTRHSSSTRRESPRLTGYPGGPVSPVNSQPFLDRLFTSPTDAQAALYVSLIDALAASGVWSALDCLYVLAASDHLTALTNLLSESPRATWPIQVGSFTPNTGVVPLGTSFYLDAGFNPAYGGHFTQDSACLFAWNLSATPQPGYMLGVPGCHISPFDNTANNHTLWAINGAEVDSGAIAADASGFWLVNRVAPDYSSISLNGVKLADSSQASICPFNGTITASSNDTCQLAVIGTGAGFTDNQCTSLYAALQTYLNSVGAL